MILWNNVWCLLQTHQLPHMSVSHVSQDEPTRVDGSARRVHREELREHHERGAHTPHVFIYTTNYDDFVLQSRPGDLYTRFGCVG